VSGICVVVHWNDRPIDPHTIHAMTTAAHHRGPDGIHTWTTPTTALAHLANHITPEDQHDHQPHTHHHLTITADARIDNRDHLIPLLHAKGHLPTTNPTDSQLILAAHHHWGTDAPTHLIGDYAYAIYDTTTHTLTAARDPMGMRPLYYRTEPHRLLIASEIKQLLAAPDVPTEIFAPSIAAHLTGTFGPLDWTSYAGISQLPPAHVLVAADGSLRTSRFWDVDPDHRLEYADERAYAEEFRSIFVEAVRCRLRSVKPVGLFLSGGVDSGSIASAAGWLLQRGAVSPPSFRTYSWAFDTLPQCDERHISRGLVAHFGFPSTDVPAEEAWPLRDYPDHGPDRDEPYIGVYQALIEHTLAAGRAEGVGLMLSGDRGDLVSGGWVLDYLKLLRSGRLRDLWEELRLHGQSPGASLAGVAYQYLFRPLPSLTLRGVKRMLRRRRAAPRHGPFPDWIHPDLLARVDLAAIARDSEPIPTVSGYARRARYSLLFMLMHMRGVVWSERTNARLGQGFADPWSDRRIASFVLAIPQHVVNRPRELDKRLVRQAMRGIMPEESLRQATKIVPSPFYRRALREVSVDVIESLLAGSLAGERGFVDEGRLRDNYRRVRAGEPGHYAFWWALTLEMWLRQYWNGQTSPAMDRTPVGH
jgi:asparagine synthase (glutamine-hydrolysing)